MAIEEGRQVHPGTVPWHRDDLEPVCTGGMGSAFLLWRFAPAELAEVFGHDWSLLGRRVFVDPERGEVTLMAPSGPHEITSRLVGELVLRAAEMMSMPYVSAGGTTWTPPGGSFRRVEADESYYLGETVLRYRLVTDEDLLNEFLGVNPPQLVVEIERTHGDAGKPGVYRDLGVAEMWRVEARGWPELSVEILGLQHPEGVRTIDSSAALPGLTPALIARTITTARKNGAETIPRLLADAGIGRATRLRKLGSEAPGL